MRACYITKKEPAVKVVVQENRVNRSFYFPHNLPIYIRSEIHPTVCIGIVYGTLTAQQILTHTNLQLSPWSKASSSTLCVLSLRTNRFREDPRSEEIERRESEEENGWKCFRLFPHEF